MPSDDDYAGWSIVRAPDGVRIAYQHYYNYYSSGGSTSFAFNDNLYKVDLDGSCAALISAIPRYPEEYRIIAEYSWVPDSARIGYRADQLADNQFELFFAAPDGCAMNNNISGTLTRGGDVFTFETQ